MVKLGLAVRGRRRTPNFDRAAIACRHDSLSVGSIVNGADSAAVGVLFLRLELQRVCQVCGEGVSLRKIRGGGPFNGSPASQTLIDVLSRDPETICDPFGENWTDMTQSLWALAFSLTSSSVSAKESRASQFRAERGDFEPNRT